MKKVITLSLALLMLLSFSVNVFAAEFGSMLDSPSLNPKAEIVGDVHDSEGNLINLVLTNFADRHLLDKTNLDNLMDAYYQLRDNELLSGLISNIGEIFGYDVKNLAVSDLFNLHIDEGEVVGRSTREMNTITYTVTIDSEKLNNFVGVLNYSNGEWNVVEPSEVTAEGDLKFTTNYLGAFAVVVNTAEGGGTPGTGDNTLLVASVCMMAAAAFVGVLIIKDRKRA